MWALDDAGRRIAEIGSTAANGVLCFTACTRGPNGAGLYYEITAK